MNLGVQPMVEAGGGAALGHQATAEFVTMTIAGQLLGIPVLAVDDVLGPHKITSIPMAMPAIAGVLNLRGRIVTAIDVRRRLGLASSADVSECMSIVVEHNGEPYSLLVDGVGDVLTVEAQRCEPNPPTLEDHWREVSRGICQLEDRLLVILDVDALLNISAEDA